MVNMADTEEASGLSKPSDLTGDVAPEKELNEEVFLKNLVILLPGKSDSSKHTPISVPPLRPDEPVASIRAALAELVESAHITNYRLVDISDGRLLDDYGDLSLLSDDSQIKLELRPYQTVREHVFRLQHMLDANPPVVKALVQAEMEADANATATPIATEGTEAPMESGTKKQKKKDSKANSGNDNATAGDGVVLTSPINLQHFFDASTGEKTDEKLLQKLADLDATMMLSRVITITYLAPPTPQRKLIGDLAYLRIQITGTQDLFVTAIPTGFYINKSTATLFDPSPFIDSPNCHAHALLDCLLLASPDFASLWNASLEAGQERLQLTAGDSPLQALHRAAVQKFAPRALDAVLFKPSWLVPDHTVEEWPTPTEHAPLPLEQDYPLFGLDLATGVQRDWNEELQSAREMPVGTLQERLERARVIYKVLTDFGDAAYKAARAIHEGNIGPMNPNEQSRSHVYLHNSIFVSRAVDAGVETFKMNQGDRAAKKAASRDANCMSSLHRLDVPNLYTLATVLIDYLGTRYVCQSIVPGILQGEKTHTLVYGAVEASAPLAWEPEMHELLENSIGKLSMCATRTQPTQPLTDERLAQIEALRTEPPLERTTSREEPTTKVCGPIEGKGIKGSDQRYYVLDLTRLTPRDANWVPKSLGGTGKWEDASNVTGISASLDDDEFVTAVLRPELVTLLTHQKMAAHLKTKESAKEATETQSNDTKDSTNESSEGQEKSTNDKESLETSKDSKNLDEKEGTSSDDKKVEEGENTEKKISRKKSLTPEEEEYMASLRYNVNVFLPTLRSLNGIDDEAAKQLELDEERAREAATYLWDTVLPKITREIKEGDGNQLPLDGKSMVELLHQCGINCRYLGRLATLAAQEEAKDQEEMAAFQAGRTKAVSRRVMPLSWLELLEVEMIARASKHVLDSYLNEEGGQTLQIVASFLSAMISEAEETAGDTEKRLKKTNGKAFVPDDEDFAVLTLFGAIPVRARKEVWDDVEKEIARKFRYKLSLYNCGKPSGRASYPTLLRRLCQRSGVRLVAKNYDMGAKCLCASDGRLTLSYPISPLDIVDIVPLMKHAGAMPGEGFVPCAPGPGLPALHVLFPDARATFEAAHFTYEARALQQALDLAQEAATLYQRVVDGPLHLSIARCLDLTAAILFEAGEPGLAATNAARSLGLSVQLGGFDCAEAMAGHSTLSHILLSSQQVDTGVAHLKAAAYLMELLAGPRYVELANCYYKIGSSYQTKNSKLAFDYFKLAQSKPHSDRLAEGMMAKGAGLLYAKSEEYRAAVDAEKRALQLYSMLLGETHELTMNSQKSLGHYTKLAVEQGTKKAEDDKLRKEEEAADAMASQIEAEEAKAHDKKKGKGKKKK